MGETQAEVVLPTSNLRDDIAFFTKSLGLKMDTIFPADDPAVAVLSGHGIRIRLDAHADAQPGLLRIATDDADMQGDGAQALQAPGGTRVEFVALDPPLVLPQTEHSFVVRRLADQAPWVIGRAGMHYRDLIPDRLGGSIIASHIRIPDGGPVPDTVHYHTVGFQLIFCYKGWVDLVYEDQGEPFRLFEGCCVIQPPQIRHRVLFASDNIEVIEIGVPAEHITTIDHDMELPNGPPNPQRRFDGQRFVHHKIDEATWRPFRLGGFEARDSGINDGTNGVANVQVARRTSGATHWATHDSDILFTFVMEGSMQLEAEGQKVSEIATGDAFVIPPGMAVRYSAPSVDLELLEVSLPGQFATQVV